MKRTSPVIEQQVLTKILLGESYPDISRAIGVPLSTIKKIRARHKEHAAAMWSEVEQESVSQAKASLQKAYKLLNDYLDEGLSGSRKISIREGLLVSSQLFLHEQVLEVANGSRSTLKKRQEIERLLSKLKRK